MPLPFTHLTSVKQLTPEIVDQVLKETSAMEKVITDHGRTNLLKDEVIALLFYEASSRTMLSFQTAVQRLGAGMILAHGKENSSFKKGESIEDTIRMVNGYADLIVMRHDQNGAADIAASVCEVPFINAGDGGNEHPTQSLLDAYTIWKETGQLKDLHIAFACDPKHSRVLRSLAFLMSQYPGVKMTFISPPDLKMKDDLRSALKERQIPFEETDDLKAGTRADILCINRLQEERFANHDEFEKHRRDLILTAEMLKDSKTLIIDPLPRIDEIDLAVDALPNAAYFRQAKNGVPLRMALLKMMLE